VINCDPNTFPQRVKIFEHIIHIVFHTRKWDTFEFRVFNDPAFMPIAITSGAAGSLIWLIV